MRAAGAGLLLTLTAAGAALAQPETRPLPSQASQCVVATDPTQPVPVYPFEAFRKREAGRVKVELRFTGPDKPPRVRVLEDEGGSAFSESVKDWVKTLRAPCMGQELAVLEQEYLFKPFEERVNFGPTRDADPARRAELTACLRPPPQAVPRYPSLAVQREIQGRVHGKFTFRAPDQPPEVELLHQPGAKIFAEPAAQWAQAYRLPCFEPERDPPYSVSAVFVYKFEGSEFGFKPLTLLDFMRRVKGLREQTLQLDTHGMACPFDVQLTYLMPQGPNVVGVRGEYRPEREPLLQWLRTAELELPRATLDSVYADVAEMAVPCIKLDLKPKEKTP